MQTDHNGDGLDWDTYKRLVQIVNNQRQEYIDERENEFTEDWRKHELLLLQMAMTDIRARMLDTVVADMDRRLKKKES